ncbi:helix-turn-helix domain-containing protein [Saccharothrix coeruleofusca]|uniref:Transcriptional regulator n=1 Tax=Saccharothrix coeruleofusca TaxID=33919 RepID=A0A918ATY5_9PSEU|nr:helix-turn-helix transcriptional regulator [Saccharothrix coeruleofusca]MBP2339195.1 transcriptional regulator with XRE-family HTH domain [Saccharothrix coeruleofusca]GGP70604.1 transcriptional regulator [Saccharothrix coeruleofusca]
MTNKGASFRQRRVSAELRTLRTARKLSCADVARAIGVSESKISRMETGRRGLYADEVAAILGYLQTPPELRRELVALVRAGENRNWHTIHGKLPGHWRDLIELEAQASALYNYEPLLIPGLAQTSDYARTIIRGGNEQLSEGELESLVAIRMGRQAILGRIWVNLLIDETVLRRPLGNPAMMRAQLQHLVSLAARPNVLIQVVPFDSTAHPGLEGPFLRLEFNDQPGLVYVESRSTSTFLEEETHLQNAKLAWQRLRDLALSAEESVGLIAKLAGELT